MGARRGDRERRTGASLKAIACSSPMAEMMVTRICGKSRVSSTAQRQGRRERRTSIPSSNAAEICCPISPSGTLTSSLAVPSMVIMLRKPSSTAEAFSGGAEKSGGADEPLTSWYSVRVTLGTSTLWVEGESSSYLRPVKICAFECERQRPAAWWDTKEGTHVGGDQVNLGVSVLSSLGGRHVNDLGKGETRVSDVFVTESCALPPAGVSVDLLSWRSFPLPSHHHLTPCPLQLVTPLHPAALCPPSKNPPRPPSRPSSGSRRSPRQSMA